MKYLYALIPLLTFISLDAQVVLDETNAPKIGDRWSFTIAFAEANQFPVPEVGMNQTFDFSSVGSIVDEFEGKTFGELGEEDLPAVRIIDLQNAGSLTTEFPNANSASELFFPGDEEETDVNILESNESGIFNHGLAFFAIDLGYEAVLKNQVPMIELPFGLHYGDSISYTGLEATVDLEENTRDTFRVTDKLTYVATGTIITHFGTFEDIVVLKRTSEQLFQTYDLEDNSLSGGSIARFLHYEFYQKGNYRPLINYFYSVSNFENPEPVTEEVNVAFFIPRNLTTTSTNTKLLDPTTLLVSPNPFNSELNVTLQGLKDDFISLEIVNSIGQVIWKKSIDNLPLEATSIQINLPNQHKSGLYWLHLNTNEGKLTRPILLQR